MDKPVTVDFPRISELCGLDPSTKAAAVGKGGFNGFFTMAMSSSTGVPIDLCRHTRNTIITNIKNTTTTTTIPIVYSLEDLLFPVEALAGHNFPLESVQ